MFGAIVGDIVGSCYEFKSTKTKVFDFFKPKSQAKAVRFTDDTVLTIAVANCLMTGENYVNAFHRFVRMEPKRGYGPSFGKWVYHGDKEPYNSWGNGSAMRVSPVGWFFDTIDDVMKNAELSAAVTHNHPEGVKGAQAVAVALFMARTGSSKEEIKKVITELFKYNLDRKLDEIKTWYKFDVSCQGSVPEAIIAFLESTDYDDAIRNAVSLGGDADTQACMAGAIAEAYYGGVPEQWKAKALEYLTKNVVGVALEFDEKYVQPKLKKGK